ncbi:MAG: hypothetical protein H6625_08950 [Bdellovibrionaceae bacterium]|nr:hypothetical protein [Pseudobdellovibrionaceae bacterium]
MRKTIISIVVLLSFTYTQQIFSHDDDKHDMNMHEGHTNVENKNEEGKDITLVGELIGLTCFIKHGSKGASHKSCAKDCAEKGLPIGLLVEDEVYQISGEGHKSLIEAYKPLLKYLETKVMVKGKVFDKYGVKMLVIEKIKTN